MRRLFLIVITAIIIPSMLWADQTFMVIDDNMATLTITWESNSAGAAAVTTNASSTALMQGWWVTMAITNPRALPNPPDDNHSYTVKDQNGIDIFGGMLASRDTLNSEPMIPCIGGSIYGPWPVTGALTVGVTGAGASNTGTIILLLAR